MQSRELLLVHQVSSHAILQAARIHADFSSLFVPLIELEQTTNLRFWE